MSKNDQHVRIKSTVMIMSSYMRVVVEGLWKKNTTLLGGLFRLIPDNSGLFQLVKFVEFDSGEI